MFGPSAPAVALIAAGLSLAIAADLDVAGLKGCLKNASVPTSFATDNDWHTWSIPYNLRLPVTPAVVTLPTTPDQVASAIQCAAQNGLKVQAKSGGHSYASFSHGGVDGAVVVDLIRFQDVVVDAKSGVAQVGGGVRLGRLAQEIYTQGKRALAHGTCAGVGIGGHFTHGGYGFTSRAWGLALDQIRGLDVVLANGSIIHASTTQYPDIYYAMRGAADSIGIAVKFYLQTQQAPDKVVNFYVDASDATKSVDAAVSALSYIQDFVHNKPAKVVDRNLAFGLVFSKDEFVFEGTYLGSLDDFTNNIVPTMLKGLPNGTLRQAKELDWLSSLQELNEGGPLDTPLPSGEHNTFFAKSVTVPEPGLTKDAMESYFDFLLHGDESPTSFYAFLDLYGGADSQINTKDVDFAAFNGRDSLWVAQHYAYVDNGVDFPDEGLDWINSLNMALSNEVPKFSAYDNYVDSTLSRTEAHSLYYGDPLTGRLAAIKKSVDPQNVFANPQSL